MKDEKDLLNKAIEKSAKISPLLSDGVKNYLIDIDGTVGEDVPNEESEVMLTAIVFQDAFETCNKWYEEGHRICFFTRELNLIEKILKYGSKNTDLNITVY